MGVRIGAGFRVGRLLYIAASVPLGHARRLGAHCGHAEHVDPIKMLLGAALAWAMLRTFWGMATGG